MTKNSKTKLDVFAAAMILFSFIAFISFFAAVAKSEGTIGKGALANFIADYGLYMFPLYFIAGSINLFLLLGLNIALYSFLAATLSQLITIRFKRYKPFLATYYLTFSILLIALACLINLFMRGQ